MDREEAPSPTGIRRRIPANTIPVTGTLSEEKVLFLFSHFPEAWGGQSNIYRGQINKEGGGAPIDVAVKYFRPQSCNFSRESALQTFKNEIRTLMILKHEHVATVYGVDSSEENPALILLWYRNGNANEYLQRHHNIEVPPFKFILQLASVLEYLHANGVVHGDVKAANMMVDDYGNVKLIDFGSSRILTEVDLVTNAYTIRWAPRELLLTGVPTTATDVYSFASTSLELLTGNSPYNMIRETAVPLAILKGEKPRDHTGEGRYTIPKSESLWKIMDNCWVEEQRFSMSQVFSLLKDLYA